MAKRYELPTQPGNWLRTLELAAEFILLLFRPFIHCSFLLCLYLVLRLITSRRGCMSGV